MEKIEIDRTDEERADLVKSFIREYWLTVVLVIGGAIAAVTGINYYKERKVEARNEAAKLVESVTDLDKNDDLGEAEQAVKTLESEKASSGYATLASLSLAKAQFEQGQFEKAIATYNNIILNQDLAAFRDMAKIRQARVQVAAKQNNKALDTLKGIETDNYRDEATLLSGDIALAKADFTNALSFYQKGLKNSENKAIFEQRITLVKIKQAPNKTPEKTSEKNAKEISGEAIIPKSAADLSEEIKPKTVSSNTADKSNKKNRDNNSSTTGKTTETKTDIGAKNEESLTDKVALPNPALVEQSEGQPDINIKEDKNTNTDLTIKATSQESTGISSANTPLDEENSSDSEIKQEIPAVVNQPQSVTKSVTPQPPKAKSVSIPTELPQPTVLPVTSAAEEVNQPKP